MLNIGLPVGRRARNLLLACVVFGSVAACESVYEARPTDPAEKAEQGAFGNFFSAEGQRTVLFDPDSDVVIKSDEPPVPGQKVLTLEDPNYTGDPRFRKFYERSLYSGLGSQLTGEAVIDPAAVQLQRTPATSSGPGGDLLVSLAFEEDSLDFVLQQILSGILQENYIATTAAAGPVTFRTEKPIPVSSLIPILRDITGRFGLVLRRINGVYHVAPPDTMQILAAMQASGTRADFITGVIPLGSGSAEDFSIVAEALLPTGATVVPVPAANSIVVRGLPGDLAAMRQLVGSLFGQESGTDYVAIIPVKQNSPAQVAAELQAVFAPRAAANPSLAMTIVPLPSQEAVLVGAPTRQQLRDIRSLVAQLDVDLRETPGLRIIVLKYLNAADIALQLQNLLGIETFDEAPIDQLASGERSSRIVQARENRQRAGVDGVNVDRGNNESVNTPIIINNQAGQADAGQDPNNPGDLGEPLFPGDAVVISSELSVVADPRNNSLLVRSTYDDFLQIRQVVEALDVPLSQMVLEATILEVLLTDDLAYGVQFFLEEKGIAFRSSIGAGGVADPGGLGAVALGTLGAITDVNIDILITALQEVTNLRVISSPYVSVVANETARLFVGDEIPFLIASQESNTDGTVSVTNEVETRETGIILEVTPSIRPDDTVRMDISTEVSTPLAANEGGELTPTISRRTVTSDLAIRSGQTVLLGGLIQNRLELGEGGIPVLRNIPLIGNLFGVKSSDVLRTELLVLITPRVIRTNSEIEDITRQVRKQIVLK